MKQAKRHPGIGLPVMILASVIVFGVGISLRLTGLHEMQATIIDESGDRQALQNFHLSGYTRFQAENTITYFALQNGQLTGKTIPEQVQLPDDACLTDNFGDDANILAVAPEERESVNQASSYVGNTATSEAQNFWVMREIVLPDNTSLRLHIADASADTPLEVKSYPNSWGGMDWEPSNDFMPQTYPRWTDEINVRWNGSWMIGLNKEAVLYQPGIWRVTESLTEEQVQALPLDGIVSYVAGAVNVLCKSTEYGKVELFYVPQNLDTILECTTLGNDLGILYQDTAGDIRFDLVDENATCVQQALIIQDAGAEIAHSQIDTQQKNQVCFSVGLEQGTNLQYILLQVSNNGRLECLRLSGDRLQQAGVQPGNNVIQCSADGRYVLFVGRQEEQLQLTRAFAQTESTSYPVGYRMHVYDSDKQTVIYSGLLDTGMDRIWGSYATGTGSIYYGVAGELLSLNRDCYTIFPQEAQEG